jgi:hypothetical protein
MPLWPFSSLGRWWVQISWGHAVNEIQAFKLCMYTDRDRVTVLSVLINIWTMRFLDLVVWISFFHSLDSTITQMLHRVWWVCENFRGLMKMVERDHYYQCSTKWGCVSLKIFFRPVGCRISWSEFVFLAILIELRVQCVITEYREGFSCTVLVHFVCYAKQNT